MSLYVKGTPMAIDGKTGSTPGPATTSPLRVVIPNPSRPGIPVTARALTLTHVSGAGDLRVRFPNTRDRWTTIKPNAQLNLIATITHFWVEASAGTVEWEALATVAA